MVYSICNLYVLFLCIIVMCASTINKDGKVICSSLSDYMLEEILGPAFNARYMSIDMPTVQMADHGKRRTGGGLLDFYVDDEFEEELEDQPAWSVTNHVEASLASMENIRYKRDLDYLQEWHCKSRIKWTDLGPDYFPRYLRSVECLAKTCWFNMYKCKPRSFTVKILRRKRDRCVVAEPGTRIGTVGLPRDLKELWVWEERALSFCCDCTL